MLVAVIMCEPRCNALAQDWAKERLNNSPRHGELFDLKSGERTIKAFVVYPERKEKTPIVLVVHEIFGLSDWIRGVCDQLAESGVIAIAPDLLSCQTYSDVDGARKAISALKPEQIKADLDAAADYALKIPAGKGTLAVCGFCWGGGVTFAYATENPKLKAAYSFYGMAGLTLAGLMGQSSGIQPAPDEASKVANISCPVYGFYGENPPRQHPTIPKPKKLTKIPVNKYDPVIYK